MKRNRLIDAALALPALACAAIALRGLAIGVPASDVWLFPTVVLIPGLTAIGLGLSLRAQPSTRSNIALLSVSIVAGLYAVEGALQVLLPANPPSREQVAIAEGRPWDGRDKADIALELRAAGTDAAIVLPARTLRQTAALGGAGVEVDGKPIVPLADIANRTVVNCNESGRYTTFRTDEHGFNNPAGAWDEPIDVAIIGDSFVVGSCVDATDNAVARIRAHGTRVVGAGVIDFGPLSELGLLEEYIATVRPADVLWFYYEWNDLHDLRREMQVPELVAYLESDGTQGLIDMQPAIDAQLSAFIEERLAERVAASGPEPTGGGDARRSIPDVLREWSMLSRLRRSVGLADVRARVNECCDLDAFRNVLIEGKRVVDSWGGRLHLVYLPAAVRYYGPASAWTNDALRQRRRVMRIAEDVGLSVLDIHAAFRERGDGRAMFVDFRSHFNEDGYRVTAETIVEYLERLGPDRP